MGSSQFCCRLKTAMSCSGGLYAEGLEYTLNYTWSKSMTNNPGFYGVSGVDGASAYWQNYYDPKSDYGQSGFDVRNTPAAAPLQTSTAS